MKGQEDTCILSAIAKYRMRVLLRKPSCPRAVIPCAKVVRAGLFVKILPAVAEGVRVSGIRILFHAEGVVGIRLGDRTGAVRALHHIAVGIVGIGKMTASPLVLVKQSRLVVF